MFTNKKIKMNKLRKYGFFPNTSYPLSYTFVKEYLIEESFKNGSCFHRKWPGYSNSFLQDNWNNSTDGFKYQSFSLNQLLIQLICLMTEIPSTVHWKRAYFGISSPLNSGRGFLPLPPHQMVTSLLAFQTWELLEPTSPH